MACKAISRRFRVTGPVARLAARSEREVFCGAASMGRTRADDKGPCALSWANALPPSVYL